MCFKKNDGYCFFVMGYGMLGDGLTNLINECVGAAFVLNFVKKIIQKLVFN